MLREVAIILALIVANGIFAMSEAAVISARKARLQQQADEGDVRARAALALANAPDRFLSTVQIGITLIGILAGAFGGATIAESLAHLLEPVPVLAPYAEVIGFGVVVLGIAYLSLVIGELVPKRLALRDPEGIAAAVAGPMSTLSRLVFPAERLLSLSTDLALRLLRIQPSDAPPVTEEEVKVLIAQGTEVGVFNEAEQDMVEGVFQLSDRRVSTLMTPRKDIIWLDVEDPPEVNQRKLIESAHHSRFPVCQGSLDNVLGVAPLKELLIRLVSGQPLDVQVHLEKPLYLPETALASNALHLFRTCGCPLALVINEYGSIEGLITLNDVVEVIVGDMEPDEPELVQRDDGSWLVDGLLPMDEFKETFHLERMPDPDSGSYETVGGLAMATLGRIPAAGDEFEWGTLHFEVMDMDGNRVDKVLVTPVADVTPEGAAE